MDEDEGPDLTRQELNDLEKVARNALDFANERRRAAERIRPFEPHQLPVFVALAGSRFEDSERMIIPGFSVRIDKVVLPPGIFEILNAASHDKLDYLGVARLAERIVAQASVVSIRPQETNLTLDGVWNFLVLVRLAAGAHVWSPAWSSVSWPHMVNHKDRAARVGLLDPEPRALFPKLLKPITDPHLDWAQHHYMHLYRLRERGKSGRFTMALEEFHSWIGGRDLRQCLASIWVGLEALYGDRADFSRTSGDKRSASRKMVQRMAAFLSESPDSAADLYDRRSEVLHGRPLAQHELVAAVLASDDLLRRSLIRCVETEALPLPDWQR